MEVRAAAVWACRRGRASARALVWLLPTVLVLLMVGRAMASAQRFGRPPGQQYPYAPEAPVNGHRPGPGPGFGPFGRAPGPGLQRPNYPEYGEADDGGLGASCDYDEDCYSMEHTFCRNQQTCECKKGFVPSASGDRCMATVGARCNTKYDCSGLGPAGDCRQGVCDCGGNHVPAPDGTCVQSALKMNDACQLPLQCQGLGEGAVCVEGKCQCAAGKHAYNDKCLANRGLHEPCAEAAECYIGEGYQSVIRCHVGTGTCQCREHYVDDGHGKCTSGAKGLTTVLTTVLVGLALSYERY